MKTMVLGNNNLLGSLPSNICQGLPNITYIDLSYNGLSGDMPNDWHQCKEMEALILSYNNFSRGPIPGDIRNMTKLQYLYLDGNNLEGKIFSLTTLFVYYLLLSRVML